MALSVVDLYKDILPKTNCKECGYPTCLAFASMVVSEKHPLANCPKLDQETLDRCIPELEAQYAEGKWLKRDMANDAINRARERVASLRLEDLPARIGGILEERNGTKVLSLPYFDSTVFISDSDIEKDGNEELTRYEKVAIYIHMAQGGSIIPTGLWKGFVEFPNTVSKVKSMKDSVEAPLIKAFAGKSALLIEQGVKSGGRDISAIVDSADAALAFQPFPRVPVRVLFWDRDEREGIEAEVKFLFDETITEHLDIESIMFLSERIKDLLCSDI